jgi:hypothetical protein
MNVRPQRVYDSAPTDADALSQAGFRHIDSLRRLVREVGVPAIREHGARLSLILHPTDFGNDSLSAKAAG